MANGFNYTLPQLPYKEYVALITQYDGSVMQVIVIYNSLGFIPDYNHDDTGIYRIADTDARFPQNKTVILYGNTEVDNLYAYHGYYLNEANIIFKVYRDGTLVNDVLYRFPITIRIYP